MASKYAGLVSNKNVPQSEKIRDDQVQNNAGGFVFALDKWSRLDRFLILGSDAPTYYQGARKLTRENAKVVNECYAEDAVRTVQRIVDISTKGRAPKNDPAIFALALGAISENEKTRQLALGQLNAVCRTGTHLFQFVSTVRELGKGWGRALKRAVANWYQTKDEDKLAFQAIKYRAREGYTHKRLLQTAHPDKDNTGKTEITFVPKGKKREQTIVKGSRVKQSSRAALYRFILGKDFDKKALPDIVTGHIKAMESTGKDVVKLVKEYNLPWEAIPTSELKNPDVWVAMLPNMGLTAMIRNLGRLTSYGVLKPLSAEVGVVVSRLTNQEELKKARVHPYALLQALAVYRGGHSIMARQRGAGMTWTPVQPILDALDRAFYMAFANVKPTGKRQLLALDVSGSMSTNLMGGVLSAREGSAAMALVTANVEPNYHMVGFTSAGRGGWGASSGRFGGYGNNGISPLSISPRMRLDTVVNAVSALPFGGTDCALPMMYAMEKGLDVDAFVIYTDNETWAGTPHPSEALKQYRKKSGIKDAKLIVVGMTSTGFTIADPKDAGMMDFVGFDASAPALMADFIRGGSSEASVDEDLEEEEA